MTQVEIIERIQAILRDVLDLDDLSIGRATSAPEVEGWDSLAHINIIVAMEKDFGVRFALGELEELKNVGDMVDLVHIKTGK
jgi:acyl carrier protein